jgi:putative oxidoreductase
MVIDAERVDGSRLVFPSLAALYERVAPYSYSLMRFVTGACLVPHGILKLLNVAALPTKTIVTLGLPAPHVWAYAVAVNESLMALLLAIGLFTRLAALTIFIEMTVIAWFVQIHFGYFWTQKGNEFPLVLELLCLAIFFRGGDKLSVDSALRKEL